MNTSILVHQTIVMRGPEQKERMIQWCRLFQKESSRRSQLNQYSDGLTRLLEKTNQQAPSNGHLSRLAQSTEHLRDGVFDTETVFFAED